MASKSRGEGAAIGNEVKEVPVFAELRSHVGEVVAAQIKFG